MPFQRRQKELRRKNVIQLVAFIGVVVFVLLVLLAVDNMLVSALLAFVISYLVGPVVNSLERAGINRLAATSFVFALGGALMALAIFLTVPLISTQLSALKLELPKYIQGVTNLIAETEARFEGLAHNQYAIDFSGQVGSFLRSSTTSLFEDVPAFITKSVTVMLLAPFLAFFMIQDGRSLTRSLLTMVPNSFFEIALNLYHQINDQMGHFVRARLLEALIVGFVTWLGLFIINFPFATLLALFAALTNLIPYIGPIVGAIPAVIIALINGETTFGMFLVISVYFVAQVIDAVFIIPLVVAKIVDLHPVTVMVAIIIGAQVMGILGMLISIPVASVLKLTLGTVYHHMTDFRA